MSDQIQSTQDKYRRAQKSSEPPQIKENEVRITTRGRVKKYVDYATRLFQGGTENDVNTENKDNVETSNANNSDENEEDLDNKQPSKQFDTIVLKATGKAINKAVTTAEVVKRTIGDLHQETSLETLEIVDIWEPKEEGLQKVETTRRVASISIKLSRKIEDVNIEAAGYQKPIAQETGFSLGYRSRGGPTGGPRGNQNNSNRRGNRRNNNNNNQMGQRRRQGIQSGPRGSGGMGQQGGPRGGPRGPRGNQRGPRGGLRGGPRGGSRGGPRGGQRGPPNVVNQGYGNYQNQGYNQGGFGGNQGGFRNQQRPQGQAGGFGGGGGGRPYSPNRRYPRNDGRRGQRRGGYGNQY